MREKTPLGELYVEEEGEGPAVVLWHSFLHHGGMWRAQVEALAPHFRVINVDAPGHGRSSVLTRACSMEDCADAVESILDARGIDSAAVCGLSWGGMVAMTMAVTRPARVRALALFDTSCRREPMWHRVKYDALGMVFRKIGAAPFLLRQIEPLFFADRTRAGDRALIDDWAQYVARLDPDTVWNGLQCISQRADLRARLASVRVPTLVVCGAEDRAQALPESDAIAAAIPGARLVVIPGAGHLSALERPHEVNEVLVPFLRRSLASELPAQAAPAQTTSTTS